MASASALALGSLIPAADGPGYGVSVCAGLFHAAAQVLASVSELAGLQLVLYILQMAHVLASMFALAGVADLCSGWRRF